MCEETTVENQSEATTDVKKTNVFLFWIDSVWILLPRLPTVKHHRLWTNQDPRERLIVHCGLINRCYVTFPPTRPAPIRSSAELSIIIVWF